MTRFKHITTLNSNLLTPVVHIPGQSYEFEGENTQRCSPAHNVTYLMHQTVHITITQICLQHDNTIDTENITMYIQLLCTANYMGNMLMVSALQTRKISI